MALFDSRPKCLVRPRVKSKAENHGNYARDMKLLRFNELCLKLMMTGDRRTRIK
jgi:hypothetical protein